MAALYVLQVCFSISDALSRVVGPINIMGICCCKPEDIEYENYTYKPLPYVTCASSTAYINEQVRVQGILDINDFFKWGSDIDIRFKTKNTITTSMIRCKLKYKGYHVRCVIYLYADKDGILKSPHMSIRIYSEKWGTHSDEIIPLSWCGKSGSMPGICTSGALCKVGTGYAFVCVDVDHRIIEGPITFTPKLFRDEVEQHIRYYIKSDIEHEINRSLYVDE